MSVLDYLSSLFLVFGSVQMYVLLFIIAYGWFRSPLVYKAMEISLYSMLVNVVLKVTFQVPMLSNPSAHWFVFPSGHMQLATVFYGTLCLGGAVHYVLRVVILLIMTGIAWALVYWGYHTCWDVAGGVFFGILVASWYNWTMSKSWALWVHRFMSTVFLMYIYARYGKIPLHAGCAYVLLWLAQMGRQFTPGLRQR
ncbi:MAG: phosphatase PAP2 family protein [Legionellaceae bacterium]|nr:phosphatase PAP2 family protein [Legionellaceae bacterium]